jgi:D-alanine transaminase
MSLGDGRDLMVECGHRALPPVSELFLTATTSELLPSVRVDDQRIGDGKPGPIVRRLQAAYADAVREFLS